MSPSSSTGGFCLLYFQYQIFYCIFSTIPAGPSPSAAAAAHFAAAVVWKKGGSDPASLQMTYPIQ